MVSWVSCVIMVLLGAVASAIITISLIDRTDAKRAEYIIYNPNSFCNENCKIYEDVNSRFKDPDDAWNELDSENYCWKCPIFLAQDIIEEHERKGRK